MKKKKKKKTPIWRWVPRPGRAARGAGSRASGRGGTRGPPPRAPGGRIINIIIIIVIIIINKRGG